MIHSAIGKGLLRQRHLTGPTSPDMRQRAPGEPGARAAALSRAACGHGTVWLWRSLACARGWPGQHRASPPARCRKA